MENFGSDNSGTGSALGVSKEENNMNMVFSSEDSNSAYADEGEVELGLGLSIGGGGSKGRVGGSSVGQYARILTAKDFGSTKSCSSSSASSGTKRAAAQSVSPPHSGVSQVVGWPPIRAYRMNSLTNQTKNLISEEFSSSVEKHKTRNNIEKSSKATNEKRLGSSSLFVKVNMDGHAIGRKVDLNAHRSYEALAETLDDMFHKPSTARTNKRLDQEVQDAMTGLLDGSSDFVLTYEDKDGDWMLVGDVPWEMFLCSVKRLRIMKTSEANGLGPRCQERNGRQRKKPI